MAQVETSNWKCKAKKCQESEKKDGKHQIIVEIDKDGNINVYCYRCVGQIDT